VSSGDMLLKIKNNLENEFIKNSLKIVKKSPKNILICGD